MKQKDLALIIVIAFISAVASFIISGHLFVTPTNRSQQYEVVDPINASAFTTDSKYFNSTSIDPAQSSQLGADSNQDPFNGGSQ